MNVNLSLRKPIAFLFVLAPVLLAGTMCPLPAQSNPAGTAGAAAAGAGADSTSNKKDVEAAQTTPPAQAVPTEGFKLGIYEGHSDFEVGYRWSSGIGGNDQMFRSQVNLFEGARLLDSHVTLRSTPGTGLFDRMDLSLNNWGDPYNVLRLNISRMDVYEFRASYRDLNYYNFISTFANPLLGQNNLFAQHNLNANYRTSDFELRLFPNHKIVPFVGYSHTGSGGPGFTTVGSTGNEFLLQTRWEYAADEYRGGIQFNFPMLSLTVEQGYRYMKNDTSVTDDGQPQGNEGTKPFLGQTITLSSLNRGYHGRTKLPTSRMLAKFTPFQNLRMTARYMYTMGAVDSNLGEIRAGRLVDLTDFLIYGAAADGFNGRAKKPNHNGSLLIEYSPSSRITFTDNVDTLNYHISGAGLLSTLFLNASSLLGPSPTTSTTITNLLNTDFIYNEVSNQAQAEINLGYGFAGRVGHRYTYLDVTNNDSEDVSATNVSRNTGLVGLVYRPGSWLRLGVDYENTQTNRPVTRTDLFNYDRLNIDLRAGSWKGFNFNGRVFLQNNRLPSSDLNFKGRNQNYIAGLSFEPNERFSLGLDYSRSNLFSDLLIVVPQSLKTIPSIFNERISGIGARLGLGIYRGSKAEIGYRGIINKGNAPLDYHQPYASLWIPLGFKMALKPSWQYFDYNDKLFGLEDYKTHLVTIALVYSR